MSNGTHLSMAIGNSSPLNWDIKYDVETSLWFTMQYFDVNYIIHEIHNEQ